MSENRTAELWLKIDQLHLKFLQAEETPAKLEIRKKLEGNAGPYIIMIPLTIPTPTHPRSGSRVPVPGPPGEEVCECQYWGPHS